MAYRDIFDDLEPNERIQLLHLATESTWSAGETMIEEGHQNQSLYVILDGDIVVTTKGNPVSTLGVGSIVGEMSFLSCDAACATVTAHTLVRALCIHHQRLRGFLDEHPHLGIKLYRSIANTLAHRLRETTQAFSNACQQRKTR